MEKNLVHQQKTHKQLLQKKKFLEPKITGNSIKHKKLKLRSYEEAKIQSHTLSNLIDKYTYYLTYEKNVSKKTIENYTLRLNRLVDFLGDITIEKLNRMQVLDFRIELTRLGLHTKTINYHIVAIRAFLKFLLKNDIDCMSPDKLELAKTLPREVHYLDEEDIQKILNAPGKIHTKNIQQQTRDIAILYMLYGTGLRVTELINLKKTDIKVDSNQFSVVGKGSKLRSIFATKIAREKLQHYLKQRKDNSPYLFTTVSVNGLGDHLSRNSIEEIVRKYAKSAGITKKVTPHTLRHSFATSLIKK